jgi:hypothetical protein
VATVFAFSFSSPSLATDAAVGAYNLEAAGTVGLRGTAGWSDTVGVFDRRPVAVAERGPWAVADRTDLTGPAVFSFGLMVEELAVGPVAEDGLAAVVVFVGGSFGDGIGVVAFRAAEVPTVRVLEAGLAGGPMLEVDVLVMAGAFAVVVLVMVGFATVVEGFFSAAFDAVAEEAEAFGFSFAAGWIFTAFAGALLVAGFSAAGFSVSAFSVEASSVAGFSAAGIWTASFTTGVGAGAAGSSFGAMGFRRGGLAIAESDFFCSHGRTTSFLTDAGGDTVLLTTGFTA